MHLPIENPVMILVASAIFSLIFMLFFARKYITGLYYMITGGFRMQSNSKLTPLQYRQILVGAIYGRQQAAYMNSLKTGVNKAAEIANQWWNVNNREEAIKKLDYLYNEGFNSLFPHTYQAYLLEDHELQKEYLIENLVPNREITKEEEAKITENLDKAFSQIYNLEDTYNELLKEKIITCKEDLPKYGMTGWDSGRLSFFARICYDMKYISESEAWDYIQKAYDLSKQNFNNWDDFAKSYIIGRAMWGGLDSDNEGIIIFANELLEDKKSPWLEVKW